MSSDDYQPSRLFTVEEANATLPLVRAIVSDLAALSQEVIERRQRLAHLTTGRSRDRDDPYTEEVVQIEEELEKDTRRLEEYVQELRQIGVEPKSGPEGLIDFPAMIDGRLAFLCWKLGEPEILYWHTLDGGYAGRQPLVAETAAGDASDQGGMIET